MEFAKLWLSVPLALEPGKRMKRKGPECMAPVKPDLGSRLGPSMWCWRGFRLWCPKPVLPPWPSTAACITALEASPEWWFGVRRIADIGCGAGMLGLWLGRRTNAEVFLIDIDPCAVAAASANARLNSIAAFATISDVWEGLRGDIDFDLVIANLPFRPDAASNRTMSDSGYQACRRLLKRSPVRLRYGGHIVLCASPTIGDAALLKNVIAESPLRIVDVHSLWQLAPTERHPEKIHLYQTFLLGLR